MMIRTARDLGAAIKQARKERGYSQWTLAKEVGVHQPRISAVERGAAGVRIGLVLQILRTLNMSIVFAPASSPPQTTSDRPREHDEVDLDKLADTGLR